jgi:hypothetical protein
MTTYNMIGGTMDIRQSDDPNFWLVTMGGETFRLSMELGDDLAHCLGAIESHAPVRIEFDLDDDLAIAVRVLEVH